MPPITISLTVAFPILRAIYRCVHLALRGRELADADRKLAQQFIAYAEMRCPELRPGQRPSPAGTETGAEAA